MAPECSKDSFSRNEECYIVILNGFFKEYNLVFSVEN